MIEVNHGNCKLCGNPIEIISEIGVVIEAIMDDVQEGIKGDMGQIINKVVQFAIIRSKAKNHKDEMSELLKAAMKYRENEEE